MSEIIQSDVQKTVAQFNQFIDEHVLPTMKPRSQRIYKNTYDTWLAWCFENDCNPFQLWSPIVSDFLSEQLVSKSTRQRHLSALRTFARVLSVSSRNTDFDSMYVKLKSLHVPEDNVVDSVREPGRSIPFSDVRKILTVWNRGDAISIRNQTLLEVLFATGMRRFEITQMRWKHVNFEDGTIHVPEGKGEKGRYVAILTDSALDALNLWKSVQLNTCEYVLTSFDHKQEATCKPISGDTIYRVVMDTSKLSGVEFRPHDARRTIITELLRAGIALADVQNQAGHSQGSTTLIYAQSNEAAELRQRAKFQF